MKIVIPSNSDKRAKLASDILAKILRDGETSPLKMIVTDVLKKSVESVSTKTDLANELRRKAEVQIEERNNEMKGVDQFIRSSRDILMGLFPNEVKKLTEYGFEVDENSSKKDAEKKKKTNEAK